jgi:hypothetical protein
LPAGLRCPRPAANRRIERSFRRGVLMAYVYILASWRRVLYVGVTDDRSARWNRPATPRRPPDASSAPARTTGCRRGAVGNPCRPREIAWASIRRVSAGRAATPARASIASRSSGSRPSRWGRGMGCGLREEGDTGPGRLGHLPPDSRRGSAETL